LVAESEAEESALPMVHSSPDVPMRSWDWLYIQLMRLPSEAARVNCTASLAVTPVLKFSKLSI
jgi:hypothetical protein